MPSWPSDGDTDWNAAMAAFIAVGHYADGTIKTVGRRPIAMVEVENLAVGSDISSRPIFASHYAATLTYIGIMTKGTPAGIDDSNTVVLTIANGAGTTIVTKTYNTATQPPTSDFADLGTLAITAFTADDYLTLTLTCGTTANMPAFTIIIE